MFNASCFAMRYGSACRSQVAGPSRELESSRVELVERDITLQGNKESLKRMGCEFQLVRSCQDVDE